MKDLFKAIYAHYLDDLLATKLTGMYNTEAPPDAVFPYGVFSLISCVQDFNFGEDFENCLVQFNLFSKGTLQEICDLYDLLKGDVSAGTGFDFHDLVFVDYDSVSMIRENSMLGKVEGAWQFSVTYRIVMQKKGSVVHFKQS